MAYKLPPEIQIPDPIGAPLLSDPMPSASGIELAFGSLILSASGWRKVFAADGNEESASPDLSVEDRYIVGMMAMAFERYLREISPDEDHCTVVVATDTRPTGPLIADIVLRLFVAQGITVRYLSVAAAPEIMAYAGQTEAIDGFLYVSASHNPIGHNGVKFGLRDGSVLGGEGAARVRDIFRELVDSAETADAVRRIVSSVSSLEAVYSAIESYKSEALSCYLEFAKQVVTGGQASLARGFGGFGVVVDFNGSARTVSIDRAFAEELSIEFTAINDKPGEIAHQIVPEGAGLEACRLALAAAHRRDPVFVVGYVPDNDGDRGNLVYINDAGQAVPLAAQDTFALACIAELSWLVYSGALTYSGDGRAEQKVAIVVNGPTSLRIDRIAAVFDVAVYRAEVGEANVVGLARSLRRRGYLVPILGEGSNGGNITHPSTVRDPLATIGAVAKMLLPADSSDESNTTPFDIWVERRNAHLRAAGDRPDRTLAGILKSIPVFQTTSAFESCAKLQIVTTDHNALKSRYEGIFRKEWDKRKADLEAKFAIRSYTVINYEGQNETHGIGAGFRSRAARGGFKVLFKDALGVARGFLWMRGSGTEPVFRVMAEIEGTDPGDESYLLDWHVEMIAAADKPE